MRSLVLLALLATPALAQDAAYRSGEGDRYLLAPAEGGVTLTSTETVVRINGSASLGGQDVILLRPDCTAEADGEAGT